MNVASTSTIKETFMVGVKRAVH